METLTTSVEKLKADWPKVEILSLHMDVRKSDEVKERIAQVIAQFGRLDVAVNNAGVLGSAAPINELDEDDWHRVVDVNLNGVFRCQKEEVAHMRRQVDLGPRQGRGTIINMSSMYGVAAVRRPLNLVAYNATKHGVVGLVKTQANAYADSRIRINAICPGYAATNLVKNPSTGEVYGPIRDHTIRSPMQRLAMPEEIADSTVFLASPMSSFVHGAALVVDGGFTHC